MKANLAKAAVFAAAPNPTSSPRDAKLPVHWSLVMAAPPNFTGLLAHERCYLHFFVVVTLWSSIRMQVSSAQVQRDLRSCFFKTRRETR